MRKVTVPHKEGWHAQKKRMDGCKRWVLQVLSPEGGRGQPAEGANILLPAAGTGYRAREKNDHDRKNKHKRRAQIVAAHKQDSGGRSYRQDNHRRSAHNVRPDIPARSEIPAKGNDRLGVAAAGSDACMVVRAGRAEDERVREIGGKEADQGRQGPPRSADQGRADGRDGCMHGKVEQGMPCPGGLTERQTDHTPAVLRYQASGAFTAR